MTLAVALAIPWLSAVALLPLDGRRVWVGRLDVAALGASFVATLVLATSVWHDGARQSITGDWPAGVGIT